MTIMDSQSMPEPSPVGDRGNMVTDISDSFKRAFQDMATEREGKKVDNYHSQEQIFDDLRKQRNELKNNLVGSSAKCDKELLRDEAVIKSASSFQSDTETLRSSVAAKSKEINALKTEMASYGKKSVAELARREKATESSMLRKAREIEALNKQLELSSQKCADFEMKATEKTLEATKGHGDNAASRIFDL